MNKHKQTAIVTAILGLCASFAFWTDHLNLIPFPAVPHAAIEFVDSLFVVFRQEREVVVAVHDVEVEELGDHFTRQTEIPVATASVITRTRSAISENEEVTEDVAGIKDIKPAAPPTELEQWELKRAWGIAVPSLGIRAPVILPSLKYWSLQAWDLMEEQMQVGLNSGTVAYPHSSKPGDKGSLIIAGHSSPPTREAEQSIYGDVFARLPDIEVGQDITVTTSASLIRYRVEKKMIVSPNVTSILEQQYDDSVLKLITCYPVGTTTSRMIIIAKKIEE